MSQNKKIILKIYLIISALFALNCFFYYFKEISLRGYYSDVILFWVWLLMSFIIIILFWKNLLAKLLLASLVLTLTLSIIAMMIPFYALVLSTTSLGLYIEKNLNEKYRAQIVGYSAMTAPWLEIIEKKGPIEKRILKFTDAQLMNDSLNVKIRSTKDIIFKNETDSTLTLTLFYGGPNKTITFNKNSGEIIELKNN